MIHQNETSMLKSFLIIPIGLLLANIAPAQSIDEAKKQVYYERYSTAENTLHNLIQKNTNNAEAWYLLGQTYLHQNKAAAGSDSLSKAPAPVTDHPIFQVSLGHYLLQQGDAAGAKQHFDKALQKTKEKDENILGAVAKAHIETKQGDANYAIELLKKAIKRDKKNPEWYMAMGDAYRKLDNGTEAYKAYYQALDKNGKYAAALTQIGNIFVTQKNSETYLKFFNDAIAADPDYAPAYYDLYLHYYFREPAKAMEYFNQFVAKSDVDPENDYRYTDLLYLTKQYDKAIQNAEQLIAKNAETAPRLYKLIAYSYEGMKDTTQAVSYMQEYFAKAPDSVFVVKDFETMGDLYMTMEGKQDSAALFYEKAAGLQTDSTAMYAYYKKLADLYKTQKDYPAEAKWLGKFYEGNSKANNLDLFNWGIAHYRAKEYDKADTVFGIYIKEHPDQGFGYYWRARSNSVMDSALEKGLAIPYYEKVVELASKDTADETNKKWLIEAYGYLAAYETNVEKDYAASINYFKQLLEVDPENKDAEKYIAILEKNLQDTGLRREQGKQEE